MDGNFYFSSFCDFIFYRLIRIQVGDQIISVNDQSLVGVTHACATNILKTTSGLVK